MTHPIHVHLLLVSLPLILTLACAEPSPRSPSFTSPPVPAAEALELLAPPPPADIPGPLRQRFLEDRAKALGLSGRLGESAQALSELDLLLANSPSRQRLNNQVHLLRTLGVMEDVALQLLRAELPDILAGWIDLVQLLRLQASHPDEAAARLRQWRMTHPGHPALPALLDRYPLAVGETAAGPRRIGVLLPRQGPYAEAGTAIRDGLLAAYYAQPLGQRPGLRFYDANDPSAILSQIQQAAADGADAVIGPLQKDAVARLAQAQTLPISVLALNQIPLDSLAPDRPPEQLFQFALNPEEEARQAAEQGRAEGARFALALTPAGSWGERLYGSFRDHWQVLEGRLTAHQAYGPGPGELDEAVRRLLGQASIARGKRLEQVLGQRLVLAEAPPHHAAPGILFLVASNPAKARELWPQVRFYAGADVPAYTTSYSYAGRFDPQQDLDLVGLIFPDMPWLLQGNPQDPLALERLPESLAARQGLLLRLVAMGLDSYRLLPCLHGLRDFPTTALMGATGELRLSASNQVRRRLLWARMTTQGPQVLGRATNPALTTGVTHGSGQ